MYQGFKLFVDNSHSSLMLWTNSLIVHMYARYILHLESGFEKWILKNVTELSQHYDINDIMYKTSQLIHV